MLGRFVEDALEVDPHRLDTHVFVGAPTNIDAKYERPGLDELRIVRVRKLWTHCIEEIVGHVRITRAVNFAATGAQCGYDVITWSASAACAPDVRCEGFTHSRRQLLDAQARSATLIACGVRRDVALRDSPVGIEIPIPNQEEDPSMPEQKRIVETVKSGIIDSIR